MLSPGDRQRRERYKSLATPTAPQVWQCAGADDRSPFFFAWGERAEASGSDTPGGDLSVLGPDNASPLYRPSRRGLEAESTLWIEKIDVDALLAAKANGRTMTLDDEDDSSLSISRTALYDRTKRESDPGRYLETTEVPFVTISTRKTFRATGVMLGDLATVINPRSGLACHAIVGDGRHVAGAEPSLFLAEALGLAVGDPAVYLIHPGSGRGQGTIPTNAQIHRRGDRLFGRPPAGSEESWAEILGACFFDLIPRP